MIRSSNSTNTELEMFCVFYVDMESSTYNTAHLCPIDYTTFYTVFYDTISDIASRFGGRVIKHIGDAMIIYFPATYDSTNREAFQLTLDCAMTMLDSRCAINTTFHEKGLPSLSYRISADYGRMKSIETETSSALDWIGPSMNMVAKMNHLADSNSMVVGGDLHQILSRFSFREYLLELTGELNIGIKQKYPVYSITKRKRNGAISSHREGSSHGSHTTNHLVRDGIMDIQAADNSTRKNAIPNIVIVDDENDILLTYKRYLSSQPVNIELFSDPVQLLGRLALVGPSYYDLAIIDIRMPKISGFQVYQILAVLKPSIKALFVSALDHFEVLEGLRRIDMEADFIGKPISQERLVNAVNRKIKLFA